MLRVSKDHRPRRAMTPGTTSTAPAMKILAVTAAPAVQPASRRLFASGPERPNDTADTAARASPDATREGFPAAMSSVNVGTANDTRVELGKVSIWFSPMTPKRCCSRP